MHRGISRGNAMSLRAVVVSLFAFMANGAPAAEPPLHDGFNVAIKTLGI